MANEEHLQIIRQGAKIWNEWRQRNPELIPDLSGANLSDASLSGADLSGADLSGAQLLRAYLTDVRLLRANLSDARLNRAILGMANLSQADLARANLFKASLRQANLSQANLFKASLLGADLWAANLSQSDLSGAEFFKASLRQANLSQAILSGANLSGASLSAADLSGADLSGALLIGTNLCNTTLTGCSVYGASVWDIKVNDQTNQQNLVITPRGDAAITVDNIKVAQFIYLLLNNQEIRDVIDTITSKAVLILGRFSEDRKPVLNAIREELRKHDYLPIMFDFDPTTNQTINETVKTLAGMSRFVIADITDARSVPQELQIIDTYCRTVAVRLIKKRGEHEYGMLDFRNSPWFVSGRYEYESLDELIASIRENIIGPAEAKVKELRQK